MLFALAAFASATLQSAHAAGTPDITLSKSAPARVLFGGPSTVTLTAAAPAGQPYGFNLTFRDVLPAGISYVPGSASPAPAVLTDRPVAGQTTLIWSNVSDLAPNSSRTLTYQVVATTAGAGALRVGDSYTNSAGAYIEGTGGERDLPKFDATGAPIPGSYTGSATASATSELIPLKIVKTEPSPEGELLRGVHDHQTTYTLTVSNNLVNATNGVTVDDFLPAGLEFLGCGGADNTTTGPEYPGAGTLAGVPLSGGVCPTPTVVDTVLNPAGYPAGVYTHVQWSLGNLAPGAVTTIQYKAAIPIHANTMTFAGGPPASQGANLDNNTGPESHDEQALTNYSSATGSYQGAVNPAPLLSLAAVDQLTRTAEDMRILKSVTPDTVAHGQISTWSLDIATSEYRGAAGMVATDTLPNGLCPLGTVNFTHAPQVASDAECDPQAGQDPNPAYASPPQEQADGTWLVTFDPADLGRNGHAVITFPTVTRVHYQSGYADTTTVLSNDGWPNTVHLTGSTTAVANVTPTAGYPAGTAVIDDSQASQTAGLPTISKQVATRASIVGGVCPTTAGSYVAGPAGAEYRAGDLVCWRVTLPFSSADDTTITPIDDFLPAGFTFITGSEIAGPANNLPPLSTFTGTANGTTIEWTGVGSPIAGSSPPATLIARHTPAYVLDVIFKTRITDPSAHTDGDITSNLVKTSSTNTGGVSDPIRSSADASIDAPVVSLLKGVKQVNSGTVNGPNVDGVTAAPGDAVVFRLDLANSGALPAGATSAWDVLPLGVFCASVSAITAPGGSAACTNDLTGPYTGHAVIRWSGLTVPAGGSLEVDYTLTVPSGVYAPGESLVNTSGVVSYQTPTDDPVNPTFTYVPAANIDASQTPNAPAAGDVSSVSITGVVHSKTRSAPIVEAGNTTATATIGELVNYTVSETIPAGTTVTGATLDDTFGNGVPARQTLVGTPVMTLDGGAATGFSLSSTATTLHVDYPATFAAAGTPRTLVVTYSTRITDVAANVRGSTVSNLAALAYTDSQSVAHSVSDATTTTIVEPNLTIAKSHLPATTVAGGDTVTYTLLVRNPTAPGNVAVAHDIAVQDVVPGGLTPTGTITGGTTRQIAGQTLSWTISSLDPGATATLTYTVTVDIPIESNRTLTNHAGAITSSLAGVDANERSASDVTGATGPAGYHAATTDTVNTISASIVKTALPTTATVGDVVTYTINTTVPANVQLTAAHLDDVLPAGVVYDTTTSTSCAAAGGGACSPDITVGGPTVGAGTLAWTLSGAGTASTVSRVITVVYTAHVTAGTLGQVKTNTATISWTSNGLPQQASDPANVTVTEPVIQLNKHVSCDGTVPNVDGTGGETDACNVIAGQALTYSIVVRNTGTSAAHDITITDTKAAHLVGIGAISNGGVLAGNTITWTLAGPIAAGGNVTLTYTGQVAPAATPLTQGEAIANTAVVSDYYGQSSAYRTANLGFTFTHYTPAPLTGSTRDIVTLNVQLPHLTVAKTHAGSFVRGANDSYGITVGNDGTTATTGMVTLDDTVPLGLVLNGTPSGTGWTCNASTARTFSCSTTAVAVAAGAFPAVTVPVTVLTSAAGPVTNTATASGGGDPAGPATGGNTSPVIWSYDLAVQKDVDHAVAQPGDTLTYTVTVTNAGVGTSEAGGVSDSLPAGLTLVSAPGCTGTPLVCAVPVLASGAVQTFTITATIDAGVADGTVLANSATVSSPNDGNAGNNTDGATTTAHDPQLAVAKTHPGSFVRGTSDHYDITVSNASAFVPTAGAVTLADDVPAGLTPTGATGSGWTCTVTLQHVQCARTVAADTLAPGAAWPVIRVAVDVLDTAPASLHNDATASGGNDPTPATGGTTSAVVWDADLGIAKSVDRVAQLPGGALTYTLTVTNHGPGSSDTATVTDVVPADETFVSVAPSPACTQTAGTVTCAFGHIPPGGTRVITIATVLNAGLPPQLVIPNTASVSAPTGDSNPANDTDGVDVTVGDYADIQIVKSGSATSTPGGVIHYALTVTNNGPTTSALNTAVRDSLPTGLVLDPSSVTIDGAPVALVMGTPTVGACAATTELTCALGSLNVGVTHSIAFAMTVPAAAAALAPSYDNLATVTSDTPELPQDTANDLSHWTTTIPYADVSITKTASSSSANPGGAVAYTLTAINNGPSTASAVVIDDTFPAGLVPTSATVPAGGSGSCAITGQAVHCSFGDRPAGDVAMVVVSATVDPQLTPQSLANTATVASGNDFDPSNDSASATVAVTLAPPTDLRIEKTLETTRLTVGAPAVYELTISNRGPMTAEDVVARDALPTALDVRSVQAPRGISCTTGRVVTCRVATLAAGATARIRLATIATRAESIMNTATVSSATADSKPSNNRSGVAGVFRARRTRLSLTKTTPTRQAAGGGHVRYAITIRNAGSVTALAVKVCDVIPTHMTVVSAIGARYRSGNACWTIAHLPAHASKRVSLVLRLDNGIRPGQLVNGSRASAANAPSVTARASIRVMPADARPGIAGVTG